MGKQSTGDLSATAKGTDKAASGAHPAIPVSIGAMLVTLGVVYGDIGTSPMYVTKALVAGNGGISVPLGLGAESGLPVSAQLQGPAFADASLLTFARAIERSFSPDGGAPVAPAFAGKGGELA